MKKEKYQVIKFNGENDECLRLFDNIDEAVTMAKSIARTNQMNPSQTYHCNMILQYCKWDGSRVIEGVGIIKIFENEVENEKR